MNIKTILLFLGGVVGTILLLGGAYITFINLIKPEGQLFEGIVLMSLGFILDVITIVATTIGQTIIMFSDVLKKQTELYEEVRKQREEQSQPRGNAGGLGGLFSELIKNAGAQGSISIQDLDDPDGTPKIIPLGDMDDIDSIKDIMLRKDKSGKNLSDLSMEQLEEKLSTAVTEDKFEEAEKIKKEIQSRKSSSDGESEKKGD